MHLTISDVPPGTIYLSLHTATLSTQLTAAVLSNFQLSKVPILVYRKISADLQSGGKQDRVDRINPDPAILDVTPPG
jgi:hypothetical protein